MSSASCDLDNGVAQQRLDDGGHNGGGLAPQTYPGLTNAPHQHTTTAGCHKRVAVACRQRSQLALRVAPVHVQPPRRTLDALVAVRHGVAKLVVGNSPGVQLGARLEVGVAALLGRERGLAQPGCKANRCVAILVSSPQLGATGT